MPMALKSRNLLYPGMLRRVVWQTFNDVSEYPQIFTKLHSVTTQKIVLLKANFHHNADSRRMHGTR
jgi:hypothetical protein